MVQAFYTSKDRSGGISGLLDTSGTMMSMHSSEELHVLFGFLPGFEQLPSNTGFRDVKSDEGRGFHDIHIIYLSIENKNTDINHRH